MLEKKAMPKEWQKKETAKNLLQIGLSKEDISKATGLSLNEINVLN